ncbi:L-Ala-D/L-Glu epimerase [Planctomycetes bacterium Pan216]|uniref:Dipeptide epimerase n=1 Tax=Kolteria novifilia TaxID=2527975 RepID=A0A518B917_9BACT|nr:L-Ala-D/L-Glu epimerase [Planctomycetes bacterium Pan216]
MTTLHHATTGKPALQVANVELYHVRIPFKRTVRHASHARDSSENAVVRCTLSDGTIGYGEGLPRDYVTGETIETSLDLLRRADWSGQLSPVGSFGEAIEMIRSFSLPPVEGDDRGCVGNAARCAAEIALLDAYGQAFGTSLYELCSLLPGCQSILKKRRRCRYSGAITSKSPKREVLTALKFRAGWFFQCKIKVGTRGQDDVARLRRLRRFLGPWMNIRIDANEAWTPEEVVERIKELEPFKITSVEQPVAHEQVDCLREVRQQVDVPIMLDESLCGAIDAERAIADRTCDLFNIRLSKCGGLIPSLELAALAQRHGLGYQLGCQVGETGILSAAGRHFGCTVDKIRYLEGSYDKHLVKERLTREDLTFGLGGVGYRLKKPGLGVTIDPESLSRVTIAKEQLHG